jgi:hypothetical protein
VVRPATVGVSSSSSSSSSSMADASSQRAQQMSDASHARSAAYKRVRGSSRQSTGAQLGGAACGGSHRCGAACGGSHRCGCHLLGRTHEVNAPTGLPKAMESARRQGGNPRGDSTARHQSMAFLLDYTPMGGPTGGGCSGCRGSRVQAVPVARQGVQVHIKGMGMGMRQRCAAYRDAASADGA